MSNYTKTVDFAAKDALITGDPAKLVKGTEIGTEYDNLATAIATKGDITSQTFVTPVLGVATATTINKLTFTQPATGATVTITDGKTLSVAKTLTLTGTDGTTMTFPATSATIARTDAANTFTGNQTVTGTLSATGTGTFGSTSAGTLQIGTEVNVYGQITYSTVGSTALNIDNLYDAVGTGGVNIRVRTSGTPINVGAFTATGLAVTGTLSASSAIKSTAGDIRSVLDGSDSVASGAFVSVANTAETRQWLTQLSASNNLDWWHLNGSWAKCMTLSPTGLAVTGTLSATGITSVTDATDATSTTAASLKTAGGLAVAKKTYCGDDIVMASGKGIDFSATADGSGTTTSEVLSDYEEGTHTTAFVTGAGSITISTSFDTLAYTKIGRQVTVTGRIAINTVSTPSSSLKITLPFTAGNLTELGTVPAGSIFVTAAVAASANSFVISVLENSSDATISLVSGTTIADAAAEMQAATTITICLTYFTA